MKNNFVIGKWTRLLRWVRLQWNQPTSDSAIWRENSTSAPLKPARTTGSRPRRGARVG